MNTKTLKTTVIILLAILSIQHALTATSQYAPPIPPESIVEHHTTVSYSSAEAEEKVEINVSKFDPEQPVKKIEMGFKKPVKTVQLDLYVLKSLPPALPTIEGVKPVSIVAIVAKEEVINLATQSKLVIEVKQKLSPQSLVVYVWNGHEWVEVRPDVVRAEAGKTIVEVGVPGIANYLVVGVKTAPVTTTTTTTTGTATTTTAAATTTTTTTGKPAKPSNALKITAAVAVAIIVILVVAVYLKGRK
ncbi:MAG: hypothetical protein F7C38_02840 [Desulfurococcales archaeon]|nr:hypothetical protein [Desulfurococcales archaeon]